MTTCSSYSRSNSSTTNQIDRIIEQVRVTAVIMMRTAQQPNALDLMISQFPEEDPRILASFLSLKADNVEEAIAHYQVST